MVVVIAGVVIEPNEKLPNVDGLSLLFALNEKLSNGFGFVGFESLVESNVIVVAAVVLVTANGFIAGATVADPDNESPANALLGFVNSASLVDLPTSVCAGDVKGVDENIFD